MRPAARFRLVLIAGLLATACGLGPDTAATVNGHVIPAETLRSMVEGDQTLRGADFAAAPPEERYGQLGGTQSEILTALIARQILGDVAQELGVALSQEERTQAIDRWTEGVGGQEQAQRLIQASGLGEQEFYDLIAELPVLEQKVVDALTPEGELSTEQLRDRYERNLQAYEVRELSQIVVQSEQEAEQIRQELEDGADFAQLASERSIDPATSATGGVIGEVARENLQSRPEIAEAVFAADEGEVVGPYEVGQAYLLLRVGPGRTIPFADALDSLREQAREEAQTTEAAQRLAGLFAQADVQVNPRFGRWDPSQQRVVDEPVAPTAVPAAPEGESG